MGVDGLPALLEAVGFQMCFTKDYCYKTLWQDYILYNNKVLFSIIRLFDSWEPVCACHVLALHLCHCSKHLFSEKEKNTGHVKHYSEDCFSES